MIQFKTVSSPEAPLHVLYPEEFAKMDEHLRVSYPLVWEKMVVEKVNRGIMVLSVLKNVL